jgi:hypothetical protein
MITSEAAMRVRSLKITGPFTDHDLAQFADLMRKIDRDHPHEFFRMSIVDAEASQEQGDALLQRLLPPLPDRWTEYARASYEDKSFPQRSCDHCKRLYQGPAVYCSIECAIADH